VVDLIKLFWCKFTYSSLKAASFHKTEKVMRVSIKWSNLQKSLSKFTPKKYYEIDPRFVSRNPFAKKEKKLKLPRLS